MRWKLFPIFIVTFNIIICSIIIGQNQFELFWLKTFEETFRWKDLTKNILTISSFFWEQYGTRVQVLDFKSSRLNLAEPKLFVEPNSLISWWTRWGEKSFQWKRSRESAVLLLIVRDLTEFSHFFKRSPYFMSPVSFCPPALWAQEELR